MSVNPYINLLCAVIQQAVQDAMGNKFRTVIRNRQKVVEPNPRRERARQWLQDPNSSLSTYLAFFHDIDTIRFREDIQKLLKNPKIYRKEYIID